MSTTCFNIACAKQIPRGEIKMCSRCKMHTYCSRECYKAAWIAGHRYSCVPPDGHVQAADGSWQGPRVGSREWEKMELEKTLNKWLRHWRQVLVRAALFALDLANTPNSPNVKCVAVRVALNREARHKLRKFVVTNTEVLTLDEVKRHAPGLVLRDYAHRADLTAISILLVCDDGPGGHVVLDPRMLRCGVTDAADHAAVRADVSAARAACWEAWLRWVTQERTPEEALAMRVA